MSCSARDNEAALQAVGAALNGAAKRIPSRRAILYKVLLGIPAMLCVILKLLLKKIDLVVVCEIVNQVLFHTENCEYLNKN